MSQLIDKLRRVAKGTATPIGFQARAAKLEPATLFIALQAAGKAPPQKAAAVLVEADGKSLEKLVPPGGDVPWGASLECAGPQEVSRLKEMGCDFILLTSLDSPAAVLDTDLGRLIMVDPGLSDSHIRALGVLADAAVVDMQDAALNIRSLMECHRLARLLGKPLLAKVSPQLTAEEVCQLAGAGVRGVISRASRTKLDEWHRELLSHPAERTPTPVSLPSAGHPSAEAPEIEEIE